MANTGLINIDVNKTVDIVSNNGINIQTLYGNVTVDSSDRLDLYSNNDMWIESDTSIDIVAPIIRINGDSLILSGSNTSWSNTYTVVDERILTLEANVYNSNTGLLATRAYITTVEQAMANSIAALAQRTDTLEATVYDANTGLASTRAYVFSLESAFANTTDALAQSIEAIVATSGIGNKTYVQAEAPTTPTYSLITGDLWFDSNDGYKMYRWNGLTWIELADQRIEGALAAVVNESYARANADSAMATTVNGVIAAIDDVAASVTEERVARVANDAAFASQLTTINARFANVEASIIEEAITRASADESLAQTIETIVVGSGVAGARTYVQSSAPTGASLGDLWFDSDDNFRLYRWSGTGWENVEDRRIANTLAAFTTERIARQANDTAMTTRIDGALSRIANSEAWISTVQTTSANSVAALANQVSQLVVTAGSNTGTITYFQSAAPVGAKTGDLWFDTDDGFKMYRLDNANTWINVTDTRIATSAAAITSEQGARVANDAALTTRIDSAFTRIANSEAWISSVQTTTANNVAALANQVTTISASVYSGGTYYQGTAPSSAANGDIWFNTSANNRMYRYNSTTGWVEVSDTRVAAAQANISTLQSSFATLNTAFSTLSTNVNARVGNVETYVTTQIAALANTTSAQATQVTNLSSNVGKLQANVTTLASTVAGLNTATAAYTLAVNAGKITGFTATSNNTTSDFIVQADKFKIVPSGYTTGVVPFEVSGGDVFVNGERISNGSIGTGKLVPGSVTASYNYTYYGTPVYYGGYQYYDYWFGETYYVEPGVYYQAYYVTKTTTQYSPLLLLETPYVNLNTTDGKAVVQFTVTMDTSRSTEWDHVATYRFYVDSGSGYTLAKTQEMGIGTANGKTRFVLPLTIQTSVEGISKIRVKADVFNGRAGSLSPFQLQPFNITEVNVNILGVKR